MNLKTPSFLMLAILVSFPQLSETIYTPSLPEMSKYFNTSANMMQNSLSIYFLGFALGVFFFGRLCDLVGRRKSLLTGLVAYIFGSLACIFSNNIIWLLAARFIQAFGASTGSVVTQTMLRDIYIGENRARIFSKLSGVLAFAPALGPVIGSTLSYSFSPIANFWFLFALGVVLFFVTKIKLGETLVASEVSKIKIWPLLLKMVKDKHIWLCAFFVAAHNGIIFSLHAEAPFVFINQLQMKPNHYSLIGLVLGASVFIGSIINSRLLKRASPYQLNLIGCTLMVVAGITLLLATALAPVLSALALRMIFLLLIACMIIGIGISLPNTLSIALKDYQSRVGSAGAIFGLMYYAMTGCFLGIMALIHNGTLWPMPTYFLMLSVLLMLAAKSVLRNN